MWSGTSPIQAKKQTSHVTMVCCLLCSGLKHSPFTQCSIMFSPLQFLSHKMMCISRCVCPVGGQCWNTYYSLMLEPIRLQPCHATGSLRPRLFICVCGPEWTIGYDFICSRPTWKFFIWLCECGECVRGWEGGLTSLTPGCDPQLQFSGSQEEFPCAVSSITSHTLTHASKQRSVCECLFNLPQV